MFEGMIRWKHHRHHFFLWSCVFRRNTGVSFSVGLSEGSCKRNISQTEFSLPSWSMNLVLCYRNFFRFASFSTLLDALHQKDCLTQSHGIHGYTHGSVDRQHQSSRFMDVAFVAMRIWHFHRNKAHRPPEEPLISGVFFGVLEEGSVNVSEMAGCKWILVLWWTMINAYKNNVLVCVCVSLYFFGFPGFPCNYILVQYIKNIVW